jgi:hypothetical protein
MRAQGNARRELSPAWPLSTVEGRAVITPVMKGGSLGLFGLFVQAAIASSRKELRFIRRILSTTNCWRNTLTFTGGLTDGVLLRWTT